MTEEIGKAMEDYENGRFITLDESSKEADSW
jgi:predicted transcriptional regulator